MTGDQSTRPFHRHKGTCRCDLTTHEGDEVSTNCQPQSGAAHLSTAGLVDTIKAFRQPGDMFGRDPFSSIDDRDAYAVPVFAARAGDPYFRAFGAVIDGIVDVIAVDTGTTLPATLVTIASYIDTEVAAIKAVTDNLPDSGALSTLDTNLTTLLSRIPGTVAAQSGDAYARLATYRLGELLSAALSAPASDSLFAELTEDDSGVIPVLNFGLGCPSYSDRKQV